MAIVQRMKSDLTGREDDPEKFGTLVIRKGPGIDKAIAFDVLPEEVGDLDAAPDVYVVEYKAPTAVAAVEVVCTLKELSEKVVPKGKSLDELTNDARFLRGRRPGSSGR
jgi:hypothetical protein